MSDHRATPPVTAEDLVAHARHGVPEANAAQARERLERGDFSLVLDVREPEEWAAGHLPGALHVPRGLLEWSADSTSPWTRPDLTAHRDGTILVYCKAGLRSLLAAEVLHRLGYAQVTSLQGGIDGWAEHGYPVEREPVSTMDRQH